jgi:hypothetical protein
VTNGDVRAAALLFILSEREKLSALLFYPSKKYLTQKQKTSDIVSTRIMVPF